MQPGTTGILRTILNTAMAKTLLLSSSRPKSCCALFEGRSCLAEVNTDIPYGQAEKLPALIEQTLKQARLSLCEVECFVVDRGPGSFTGIRASIAWMIGVCVFAPRPLHLCNRFDALHHSAGAPKDCLILLDSRRDQPFYQLRKNGTIVASGQKDFKALTHDRTQTILCEKSLEEQLPYEDKNHFHEFSVQDLLLTGLGKPAVTTLSELALYGRDAVVDPRAKQSFAC